MKVVIDCNVLFFLPSVALLLLACMGHGQV